MADLIELYGPGMSFYREQLSGPVTQPEPKPETALEKYTTTLLALSTSNHDLEAKIHKVRTGSTQLKTSLRQLQRHVDAAHHVCLSTWQADMLTLLVETVYARQHRMLPGRFSGDEFRDEYTVEGGREGGQDEVYMAAARRIDRKTLRKITGLSARYHHALQRYHEVVEFRSRDPVQTENEFAGWLASVKEKRPGLYGFWAALFPVCYCRSVDESVC